MLKCFVKMSQIRLKFNISVVTGRQMGKLPPTGARASLEIDANPMSFQKWGRYERLKQRTDVCGSQERNSRVNAVSVNDLSLPPRAYTTNSGRRRHRHGGHREQKNNKQETGQTVLTITKALTKTTKCTFRPKM